MQYRFYVVLGLAFRAVIQLDKVKVLARSPKRRRSGVYAPPFTDPLRVSFDLEARREK